MSFIGTFFHKVGAVAKKLFGSTTWEKTVQSTITYIVPLLETIVQYTAGSGAEQVVAGIVGKIQAGLSTLAAVVDGAHQGDTHAAAVATAALSSIRDNLAEILQSAEVKNSGKVTEITAAVTLLVGEVDAMLGALPAPAAAPAQ